MRWHGMHPVHAVDRPGLRARLDAGRASPLTLVVAPAGAGKSVLLSQWAASLEGTRVAWLDMSPADDDPARLTRRILREVGAAGAGPEGADPTPGPGGLGEAAVEALAQTLRDAGPIVVVFDDLHRVSNAAIISDLWSLADQLPANAHFVFASRIDLRLAWSRHRLAHGMVELRQADLAFDRETTAAVITHVARTATDAAVVGRIHQRTDGWPAGVQLSAISLRSHTPGLELDDRLAMEFLGEEVLDAMEPERRSALTRLAVADELGAGLVEAVGLVDDGAAFLAGLAHDSLFVAPVPGRPGCFRLHQLFRDVLLLRLRAAGADDEGELASIAAAWYRAHDAPDAAIDCLLSAHRWDEAIDDILPYSRELYERGESATVAAWLARVPRAVRRSRIEAEVLYAAAERMSGNAALAEDLLQGVIDTPGLADGLAAAARVQMASCVQFRPHAELYLQHARHARTLLDRTAPADDGMSLFGSAALLRLLVELAEGRARFLMGDVAHARQVLGGALRLDAAYGHYRIHALGAFALAAAWDGWLREAVEACDEALLIARQLDLLANPALADAYLARACIAIQRGETDSGALALHEGHLRAVANGRDQLAWVAYALAGMIEPEGMMPAARPPESAPPPVTRRALRIMEYRRKRESGRPATVSCPSGEAWGHLRFEEVASLLLREGADAAAGRVRTAPGAASGAPTAATLREIARAWIAHAAGDRAAAGSHLRAAIAIAGPEHLVLPFHFAGTAFMRIFEELPADADGFRREVLTTAEAARLRELSPLEDPLTARELELLAYLPSRLSNGEIAAKCFVSLNTVKTHLAHIYRKLGAASRDEAVARAAELGLVDAGVTFRTG
ncbi:LuxR C-terminal-related transcriptional regulator [Agromyces sp. LHK192]|uniref:LuxR C-terminal-related transcriptional regulator n=1 Tax=Agromyces sp. LHK192 TaxID=2498704 RepID=UPI000FD8F58C|nr:LuxR C-terminal-related transcriptional regulator [Agromyces sp. LHK192]